MTTSAKELLEKYKLGTCTAQEKLLVEDWFMKYGTDENVIVSLLDIKRVKQEMWQVVQANRNRKRKLWPRIAGIAAAVIGIAVGIYFYTAPLHPDTSLSSRANAKDLNDIAPGHNGATLTFANGKTINLSEKKNGVIVSSALKYDDNTDVVQDGALSSRGYEGTVTATTAKGRMYTVTLSDGTKVWLNAGSNLVFYPDYRNKTQRFVKLDGEGYFEVAKDKTRPFIVECKGQKTEVLGTHFNISAYSDDIGIKTTLLEGSVRVSSSNLVHLSSRAIAKDLDPSEVGMTKGRNDVVLKPNQQSLLSGTGITVKEVNPEDAIAWKNGYFMFNNESLENVMERVARWYNVKVIYEDADIKTGTVFGTISRFENVSKVLRMLERADVVRFTVEGNTIKIKKKK
ncbi:transmembrane sensor [Pedobacter africanus]|uniref:Ferric-dicitrate binding protein FerR (Iron transport regulator) n=1 Tax=Pedobacter africanus TaxID=151894 RepID=A0ACC6L182_9SPHI|nr:FecR domain-containing protein [Pedobacter africanus]MDR6785262.1 ferric-dicitrate binding protein FerR (iron transport regulator) [Pedobacter africanus]